METTLKLRNELMKDSKGYTLIEILMVIGLVAILALASMDLMSDYVSESRFQETVSKLEQIKIALVGNPSIVNQGSRTSFGILGDLGGLPAAGTPGLAALVTNSTYPAFAINNSVRFALGWNGPYVSVANSGSNITLDSWGTSIEYDPASTPATITSYGADQLPGGTGLNQDIVVSIPVESLSSIVTGYICNNGGPFDSSAEVEMNYPNGAGVLTQDTQTLSTGDKGFFNFSGVPLGVRSLTVYIPNKASATQTVGPVLMTIDSPNFTVPCRQVDLNP